MITWITTVGWSPFAVINPIWAYCKEYFEIPTKIILLYSQNERIEKNMEIIKKYIVPILEEYSEGKFDRNNVIPKIIESEELKVYADALKGIIESEIVLKPDKIILDMTPGRKYMSAINVYYGLKVSSTVPIQVLYLYLEENVYQEKPFPITPIFQNNLTDIIEFTDIFTRKFEEISIDEKRSDTLNIDNKEPEKSFLESEDSKLKKEIYVLLAIYNGFKSKSKIGKFLDHKKTSIQNFQLTQLLNDLTKQNLIMVKNMSNASTTFVGYNLTESGTTKLQEFYQSSIPKGV